MYAIVRDTPASWEDYRRVVAQLGDEPPEGLVLHVAGRTPEGVRVIEVWQSRTAYARFDRGRLRAAERRVPTPLRAPVVRTLAVSRAIRGSGPDERQDGREDRADRRHDPAIGC